MLLAFLPGCAGGRRPVSGEAAPGNGVRVLYRVDSEGPRGSSRFRLAAALRPPSAARLEFLGPVGGIRLVVATDGEHATAILPSERQFDITQGTPATMDRLLGLPLDGERLIALLSGVPLCRPANGASLAVPAPSPPVTPGEDIACAAGDIVFSGQAGHPGGPLVRAVLRDPASGAIIAAVDYGDRRALPAGRWPRDIRLSLPSTEVRVSLTALDGPAAAQLSDDLFAPIIPGGFERHPIFDRAGNQALYGAGRAWGR